jgi:Protein of unknown function (DUF3667)
MAFNPFKKKVDAFDVEAIRTCKVCNTTFQGRFCSVCGEKVTEPYERSILHFFDNLLNAFTFLDGKFLSSLKLLLSNPGQLSRNIADGKRVPYMKMVSLFFVANFFYFLFPVFDSYNSSLDTQMNYLGDHSIQATEIVKQKIEEEKIDFKDFQKEYHSQSTNLSKLLIVLLVFAFTTTLVVVNYSRQNFFSDHLLFAFEFYSFNLIVNSVVLPNVFLILIKLGRAFDLDFSIILADEFFTILAYLLIGYFVFRAERTLYHQKWYWALPKTLLLLYLLRWSIYYYRIVLFYFTMWFF